MISAFQGMIIFAVLLPLFLLAGLLLTAQLIRGAPLHVSLSQGIALFAFSLGLGGLIFGVLHVLRRKLAVRLEIAANVWRQSASDQFRQALLSQPKYQEPKRLGRFAHKAYSQNGEDGMIAEIFRRIGTTQRFFVEFGSGDGAENNTRLLLLLGWQGAWLDAGNESVERARQREAAIVQEGRLQIGKAFVSAESIEELLKTYQVPPELDLLSIDIDRNDFYVWKAITSYRPRVVIIEYNGIFPPQTDWVIDYDADSTWDGTSQFGASLKALERLACEKGYALVGCNLAGVNAFFVREDLVADHFCGPFTAENHFEPPRYWLTWGGHRRQT